MGAYDAQDAHDDEVHVWEAAGIEEGSSPVPRWIFLLIAGLVVFTIAYLVNHLVGAQPSGAQFK